MKQTQYQLTPLTLVLHLSQVGAKYFSKQYSQYSSPFSSTKPMSVSWRRHWALTHLKWSGHQFLPSAVTNGPLEDIISIILDQLALKNIVVSPHNCCQYIREEDRRLVQFKTKRFLFVYEDMHYNNVQNTASL